MSIRGKLRLALPEDPHCRRYNPPGYPADIIYTGHPGIWLHLGYFRGIIIYPNGDETW
jgi:hypothetical protein